MQITKRPRINVLLPMKGHSERVPGKNIRLLNSRPLFHWVLINLQKSSYVNNIIIDTDSQEIAQNVLEHFSGVTILDRPHDIRGDYVSMNTIINYDISQVDGEYFLQTHSTNPLLTTSTIDKAIESYFDNLGIYDSLFSVTRLQVRLYWHDGSPVNHNLYNPNETLRTQDLQPIYEENSCLYIFSRTSFFESGKWRIGLRPQMFEIDKLEAIDIDEEQDFRLAEILHSVNYNKGGL